jgi:hypothetical protein
MLYDEEGRIFYQEKRCLPALCETRWTPRVDTLTWFLKHYESFHCLFERALSIVAENEITVTKLRTSGRRNKDIQQMRQQKISKSILE